MSYDPSLGEESEKKLEEKKEKLQQQRDKEKEERDKDRSRRIGILQKIAKKLRAKKQAGGSGAQSSEDWDRILRVKDLHLFIFSMIGLLSSIFLSYFKWSQRCYLDPTAKTPTCINDPDGVYARLVSSLPNPPTAVTATVENTYDRMGSVWGVMVAAQFFMSFSTLICIILLVQYYRLRVHERRREWSGLEEIDLIEGAGMEKGKGKLDNKKYVFTRSYNFFQSTLRIEFAAETLLHLVHPILWLEPLSSSAQTAYEVLECAIFLRLYLLLRLLYIFSNTYIFRQDIVNSNKELQRYGYKVTASSTYKIMFYNNPGIMVGLLVAVTVGIFGFWMFVIERNGNSQFTNLLDCYWFVWVTLATIGYGDMTATSVTGRAVVILIAIASLTIVTIFGGIVTNLLAPSKEQKYVAGYLEQVDADVEYKRAAVNLIVVVHRERKLRMSNRGGYDFGGKRSPEVYRAIKRLRSARLAMRDSLGSASDPVVDIKLQRAVVMANRLNELLDTQANQIVNLEERIVRATFAIKQRGTLRKRGAK
jgi:hypothetical protein